MKKRYADSSEKKVQRAVKKYAEWRLNAMENQPKTGVDERFERADIHNFANLDKKAFAFSLCHFVTEVLKVNWEEYPPNTLKELVFCLQMYLHANHLFWFILDRSDDTFLDVFMY